jgi:hypothetical protein
MRGPVPAEREQKAAGRPGKLRGSRKKLIGELLDKLEGRLNAKETRITVADFIRLMQLEREFEQEEQPREIIVTWKDPSEKHVG